MPRSPRALTFFRVLTGTLLAAALLQRLTWRLWSEDWAGLLNFALWGAFWIAFFVTWWLTARRTRIPEESAD